jgi:hypothetical protein
MFHAISAVFVILSGCAYLNDEGGVLPAIWAVVFQLWHMKR